MMGFACLRLDGEFFASFDHRDGALVVKLDEHRVDHLLATGEARPFAPNGRRFKAWATVPADAVERWDDLLHVALAAVVQRRALDRPTRPVLPNRPVRALFGRTDPPVGERPRRPSWSRGRSARSEGVEPPTF